MATSSVSFVFRCPCSWRTRPAAGDTATGGGGDGDTTGKCVANCPCVRFCHPTATADEELRDPEDEAVARDAARALDAAEARVRGSERHRECTAAWRAMEARGLASE